MSNKTVSRPPNASRSVRYESKVEYYYYNVRNAVAYAVAAGFNVNRNENRVTVAYRADIPDVHYILRRTDYGYHWLRQER